VPVPAGRARKENVIDAGRALAQRLIIASPFARSLAIESLAIDADRVCVRMPCSPERTTIGEV
jgi:hypothetical protein